jgi:23S rRNA pseudouridine2604 synthase
MTDAPALSRLNKRMAELGLCSRREADEWISRGWVKVDGVVAVMGLQVGPDARIDIDPQARGQQREQVTILVHKPMGYVSGQAEDGYEPAVVLVQARNRWKDDRSPHRFAPRSCGAWRPRGGWTSTPPACWC